MEKYNKHSLAQVLSPPLHLLSSSSAHLYYSHVLLISYSPPCLRQSLFVLLYALKIPIKIHKEPRLSDLREERAYCVITKIILLWW